MNVHLKRKLKRIIAPIRRIGLKNKSFSIISNNCWGGYIYDRYGIAYKTPTIGMIIYPEDYIMFLRNLQYYLSFDIVPITVEESKYRDKLIEKGRNMVGRLDDIEVIFIHYNSLDDAIRKWNYRRTRVDFSNLLVKFNDQNDFVSACYDDFTHLDYKNKLFFTGSRKYLTERYCIFIKKYESVGFAVDDLGASKELINYKKVLNSLTR